MAQQDHRNNKVSDAVRPQIDKGSLCVVILLKEKHWKWRRTHDRTGDTRGEGTESLTGDQGQLWAKFGQQIHGELSGKMKFVGHTFMINRKTPTETKQ